MKNRVILVLDSGVGGISVLKKCLHILPNEHFLYVADNKNVPYGNKNSKKLNKLSLKLIKKYLDDYSIKLILIACNTLTASSIEYLRKKVNIPFVGVEPAIKPALKTMGKTLIISTNSTLKYNKNLRTLKKQNLKNIYFLPIKKLAPKIDENLNDLDILQPIINNIMRPYFNENINNIVLGCTHYVFIKKQIQMAFQNSNIIFFDGNEAVANRVKYLLENYELQNKNLEKGSVTIDLTKKDKKLFNKLNELMIKKK